MCVFSSLTPPGFRMYASVSRFAFVHFNVCTAFADIVWFILAFTLCTDLYVFRPLSRCKYKSISRSAFTRFHVYLLFVNAVLVIQAFTLFVHSSVFARILSVLIRSPTSWIPRDRALQSYHACEAITSYGPWSNLLNFLVLILV